MLRKLLILFFCLTIPLAGLTAEKSTSLHLKPESNSKIIGAIKNTETLILLEQEGKWSKVVDGESGMIGWVLIPEKREG